MRERTEQMIHSMNKNRHKRRRINAFITALAVLTGGNVFWELRETGMAVTEDDLCTMEAHEHSDNCYDSDGTLICGMDEHIHTADCYLDAEADTETPEVWEMSFIAPENAARQEQAALIAESQLGYTESTDNFILSENGVKQGYTRYGEWYGNPYGDWNTMFTYFCMYYAGVSAEEFPYGGNATTWQAKLKESELLHSPDSEPQRGNIILLDTDADGEADLTGIITDTEELLTVIEGDCDNTVAELKYQYDDSQILGYVALPEPDTPAEAEAVPMEFSAESPSGIQVSASAEKGTFPDDAVMTVSDISREEAMQAAENLESQTIDAVAVDITFTDAEGTELEPAEDKTVQVQITLPDEMKLSGDEYSLLHVSDDGDVQKVEEAEVSETGAEFLAESFSLYVLTSNQPVDVNNAIMINGNAGNNSADNPFVIGVGETIEVWYDGTDYAECYFTVEGNNLEGNAHIIERQSPWGWSSTGADTIENNIRKARFAGSTVSRESDNCYIVVKKNGAEIEKLYVKVVNNPVFIMDGDKRVLLESNTITRNVGDTFTLSLNGYNAYEIARKENVDSNTAYDYSESLYRGKPDYSRGDGNTYVDFVCKAATGDTPQTITVNGQTITINITNNHLYKIENGNRIPITNGTTINAKVGDKFTLSVNGYASHLINPPGGAYNESYIFSNGMLYRKAPIESDYHNIEFNGVSIPTTNVEFTCLKGGTTSFQANGQTINVFVSDIYINTALGERSKDEVHEYLSLHAGMFQNYPQLFICDENGNPRYIKNGDTRYYTDPKGIQNLEDAVFSPYRVSDGEEFEVIYYCLPDEVDNLDFEVTSRGTHTTTDALQKIGATQKMLMDSGEFAGKYRISAKFKASSTGNYRTGVQINGDYFYIIVTGKTNMYNKMSHADIEIDDGGKYVVEEYSFDTNGNVVKVITEYSAAVADINSCRMYDSSGQPLKFESSDAPDKSHENQDVVFVKEDYYKNGNPGESQFELTSNYMESTKTNESSGQSFGDLLLRGNKNYSLIDSYRADFNVDLSLKTVAKTQVTYDSSGNITNTQNLSFNPNASTIMQNLSFSLGRQSILDAYNKCPVHSGLDFTLAANAVMVDFSMKKEFVDGALNGDDFEFELVDNNGNIISTVKNESNGIIHFRNIYFSQTGTYNYTVREKNYGGDVIYASERIVTITVTESNGTFNAAITPSVLTAPLINYRTYRLPDTGGKGVIPYIVGGAAMMGAALMLLHRKRKEA